MQDFYLKFANEAEAHDALYTITPKQADEEGNIVSEEYVTPNFMNIDVIGIIYTKEETPQPTEGWHVNVRVVGDEDASSLEKFRVFPDSPNRVWA